MAQATKFALDAIGNWRIMLKDLGVSVNEVLRRARLPGDLFSRKNVLLTIDEYFHLWTGLEESFDDPCFPIRLGQMISTESFNPLFFTALCSPNLNVALVRMRHFKQLVGPMRLIVAKTNSETTITFECLNTDKPLPDSLIATELVFMVHLARLATREPINPVRVGYSGALSHRSDYTAYFGIMPQQAEANTLSFSADDADRPFLTENKRMWRFFEPELRKRLADIDADASFASRVRSSLLELIPSGLCSANDVAKMLAVSKRTLQRRLSDEKTSFQQELKQTREKLARQYLANSTLSSTQISFLLGYDDPNSFLRAFRSWTGETPQKTRAQLIH